MLAAAPRPDSTQEAPARGLAARHVVRVWGPQRAGVPSVLSASLGRGADCDSQEGAESRGGAGTRGSCGGRRGGSQRPRPLLAVFGALSLCVSLPLPVCLSVSVSVLITHHLCLSVHLCLPLCLSISASLCISVSGCLSVSRCLPLSDSPLAGLEARLQWTQPGRTLKAAEAPASELLSCIASELSRLSAHRPAGQPCGGHAWVLCSPPLDSTLPVSGSRGQRVTGLGHSRRPRGAH